MKLEKITDTPEPRARRHYEDACATAHALDLVGERWALLVMRELMLGPKRFSDLRESLPGISANVLTQRLEGLESAGAVVSRRARLLLAAIAHDPALPFSTASLVLSLRTMFNSEWAKGMDARIGFRIGEETFLAHLSDGRIEIGRAALDEAEVILTGLPPVLAGAIYGGQPLEALEQTGALRVEGDRDLARRFVSLFPLPPKVSKPA